MKHRIELPLVEPVYSTYTCQGIGSASISSNPSIRNWYLNQTMMLCCNKKFLTGYTSPEVDVLKTDWVHNPHFEKCFFTFQFIKGHINKVIREFLDNGYYVYFNGVDDYYLEGKSWYSQRHFFHDGMICGYDSERKTYSIYAYDVNWIYRRFEVSFKSFDKGRRALCDQGKYGYIWGFKPKEERVEFDPHTVLEKIEEYLDPSLSNEPYADDKFYGIAVHEYTAMYIDKLYDGSVPYEKMDRRVLRMIWEHKKVMLERLRRAEEALSLDSEISKAYEGLVSDANMIRMLYASHNIKRRDSVLPTIRGKLIDIMEKERGLLTEFIKKARGDKKK